MKETNIGFFGFGLIGGSLAKSLKDQDHPCHIQVAIRRRNPGIEKGLEEHVIDSVFEEVSHDFFKDLDFLFLCAPVIRNIRFLETYHDRIPSRVLITDVGSTKECMDKVTNECGLSAQYIGGHPMAGSEKTGYIHASKDLFQDRPYILTPGSQTTEESLQRLKRLLACTKANFLVLPSNTHDAITASISHVPHILSAALVHMASHNDSNEIPNTDLSAGAYRDMTRISTSSPDMWRDICLTNQEEILKKLDLYIKELHTFQDALKEKDEDKIHHYFSQAKAIKDSGAKEPE